MFIKAIAGINNVDAQRVSLVARAAEAAGVAMLDIAADATLVALVRQVAPSVQVVVSSVIPEQLAALADSVDMVEIGNFDALYEEGRFVSAETVLRLAQETIDAVAQRVPVCVTIPGHLNRQAQVALAQQLQAMGATLIQTEGAIRLLSDNQTVAPLNADEKAALTLANTELLVQSNTLPVMCASGIHAGNVAEALARGAVAVGIGSAVNKLNSLEAMVEELTKAQAVVAQSTPLAQAV